MNSPVDVDARIVLDVSTLLDSARQMTGLDDYGDDRFVEPFSRWIGSVVGEARLSAGGVIGIQQAILGHLTARLRVRDFIARNPAVAEEDVSDPIWIIGLPRTGTTKLQRTLGRDPGLRPIPFWQVSNPLPLPGEGPDESHVRRAMAQEFADQARQAFPDFYAAHPFLPDEPEEEAFALEFDTQLSVTRTHVPTYRDWWMDRPREERGHVYDYLTAFLQCIQWQDDGPRKPFLMKSVIHLGDLACLIDRFPNATIIHTHRDLDTSVASTARIVELMWRMCSDDVDMHAVGDHVLSVYPSDISANLSDRARLGERLQILDVRYEDILNDCEGVIADIWKLRGGRCSSASNTVFREWVDENPQYRFGKHEYSLAPYGLTPDRMIEAFAGYLTAMPQYCAR